MKWLIGIIAALAIGLTAAPVAGAGPDARPMLTANDRSFIAATDQVITMSGGLDPEWRWVGYPECLRSSGSIPPHGVLHV